jgi:hypothetical protein
MKEYRILPILVILFMGVVMVSAQEGLLGEDDYGVVVLDSDYPESVVRGENFDVETTVEYNFPTEVDNTTLEVEIMVGIWDHSVQEFISTYNDTVNGNGTREYTFTLRFPDDYEPGTYTFDASVLYNLGAGWFHMEENWKETFEIQVKEEGGGGFQIPGHPLEAVILGLGISVILLKVLRGGK